MVALGVLLLLAVLVAVSVRARRYRESPLPAGDWAATDEVFIDPSTGRRMRVWVDPRDASRHYVPEGTHPGHA